MRLRLGESATPDDKQADTPATTNWDEPEQLTASGRSYEQHEDAERDALLTRIDRLAAQLHELGDEPRKRDPPSSTRSRGWAPVAHTSTFPTRRPKRASGAFRR